MRVPQVEAENHKAIVEAKIFMRSTPPEKIGVIDQEFHRHKNHFPYFGYVEVNIGGSDFTMFSANDDLVAMTFFWYGPDSYEPMSMHLWQERAAKASTILDVGAFSGVYALSAAATNSGATIHAIEAARRTYGRLLVNTQVNRLTKRVHCTNKAVASDRGYETFQRFRGENILGIGDSFIPKEIVAQASEELVETISLDQFCEEQAITPDLIKIDVEGAEILALDGMRALLDGPKPTLLIEVTPQTAAQVHSRLGHAGYEVQVIDERRKNLIPFDKTVPGVVNLLAEAR
jgi:FkbM family methyltransferase